MTDKESEPILVTESDVEQHFILDLLRREQPFGLGFPKECIRTKHEVRQIKIGKGNSSKLHFPDYIIVVKGLPLAVVEAKKPGSDLQEALREARLYAHELNSLFQTRQNPVKSTMATDGSTLIWGPWDSEAVSGHFTSVNADPTSSEFARWTMTCGYANAKLQAEDAHKVNRATRYFMPLQFVGGSTKQDEELPQNGFGTSIALDYRSLFSPQSVSERAIIVKEAYVPSSVRDRYIEPIDRIIRAALPPSESQVTPVADADDPKELIHALRHRVDADHQIIIIVGGVGMGKSTFIDYVREVKLPRDLKRTTVWLHVNMNESPVSPNLIYDWIINQLTSQLQSLKPEVDFDTLDQIEKVFYVEIKRIEKGPLQLLKGQAVEYAKERYRLLQQLVADKLAYLKALCRFTCSSTQMKLIVVFDNSDKRIRNEQLLLFEVAQWLQNELRCLVILPLRDETYDNHRNEPPLDTTIKDLVFRIEPPIFQEVLRRRINLALREINPGERFFYTLSNGMRVSYTGKDQAAFLRAILTSVHEHDRFVRRLLTGLAGRNIRKALELFLDFCKSGHISEELLTSIRMTEGKQSLPFDVVANVLLRGTRRFYSSRHSHLKNLLACDPSDSTPNYFVRLAILKWLDSHMNTKGPTGLTGFHQVQSMLNDLVLAGYDTDAATRELLYLIKSSCVVAEHLRDDSIASEDLVKLTAAGWAHLDMLGTPQYHAAIAEEILFDQEEPAREIANKIGSAKHYDAVTVAQNARTSLEFLKAWKGRHSSEIEKVLIDDRVAYLGSIDEVLTEAEKGLAMFETEHGWEFSVVEIVPKVDREGMIVKVSKDGFIVSLNDSIKAFAHLTRIPAAIWDRRDSLDGAIVNVRVYWIDYPQKRVLIEVLSVALQ